MGTVPVDESLEKRVSVDDKTAVVIIEEVRHDAEGCEGDDGSREIQDASYVEVLVDLGRLYMDEKEGFGFGY